ncbi:hypothetical protein [Ornithinimicrobium pratense]|uniref:Uncharacterized protein n=1 Tax=Ornithinimicrobium pratense TaxID=2593973 RepID=A0A5J6V595_9MICO|nr:hypothetical protein [Ornithinimicrobium pratense]QFG69129.1 hypothetical protein FY030_10810 [Ornithinimicrobium pratense]
MDAPTKRVWDPVAPREGIGHELRVVPRVPLPVPARAVLRRGLDTLFAQRHRRLRACLAPGAAH